MIVVLGVDPSSLKMAGLAAPVEASKDIEPVVWLTQLSKGASLAVRCHEAFMRGSAVMKRIRRVYPGADIYVFMESPLMGRGGLKTTVVQAKVAGAATAGFLVGGAVDVRDANASHVKKEVTGAGNAKKEDIARWLYEHSGAWFRACEGDQDLMDASMHLQYGIDTMRKANRWQ